MKKTPVLSEEETKTAIHLLISKWVDILLLQEWQIDIDFGTDEDFEKFTSDIQSVSNADDIAACTEVGHPEYLKAIIHFRSNYSSDYRDSWVVKDMVEYLQRLVVHELLHIRLARMCCVMEQDVTDHSREKRQFRNELEGVIECLTKSLLKQHPLDHASFVAMKKPVRKRRTQRS